MYSYQQLYGSTKLPWAQFHDGGRSNKSKIRVKLVPIGQYAKIS